jgi:hypothetical protein
MRETPHGSVATSGQRGMILENSTEIVRQSDDDRMNAEISPTE